MKLHQMLMEWPDGAKELISQTDIPSLHEWMVRVQNENPLPKGASWLCVNEDSEHFVRCAE